jgi:hypothetical protein
MADIPSVHIADIRRYQFGGSETRPIDRFQVTGTTTHLSQRLREMGDGRYTVQLGYLNYLYQVNGQQITRYKYVEGQSQWFPVQQVGE